MPPAALFVLAENAHTAEIACAEPEGSGRCVNVAHFGYAKAP